MHSSWEYSRGDSLSLSIFIAMKLNGSLRNIIDQIGFGYPGRMKDAAIQVHRCSILPRLDFAPEVDSHRAFAAQIYDIPGLRGRRKHY
jgi:hypothetical protein